MESILMATRLASSKVHVGFAGKYRVRSLFVRRQTTDSSHEWFSGQRNRQNWIARDLTKTGNNYLSTFARTMECHQETDKQYERTITALNQLQSNSQNLANRNRFVKTRISSMLSYAERVELTPDDIDKLNVIHISGTKGKGSTCALTESILRHHGYKTGFFSSPHLVEVRERIRINGRPITRDLFNKYFWEVHDKLTDTAVPEDNDMPFYFGFLTLMAYHTFKSEKIDVAVMEVGIGGEYDPTNIVRKPAVCGVTSLGLDHTSVLGDTIEKIAWQKGGIFKTGVPAVTTSQESPALDVLKDRAKEKGCHLYRSPDFEQHELWKDAAFRLGLMGKVQEKNAALALQLSQIWLKQHNNEFEWNGLYDNSDKSGSEEIPVLNAFPVDGQSKQGLQHCSWKGRDQVLYKNGLTYYVDGAHTKESLEQCIDWFMTESTKEARTICGKVVKVLIFNMTGDRDYKARLNQLKTCMFDHAVFCPNTLYKGKSSPDVMKVLVGDENQLNQCVLMKEVWDQPLKGQKAMASQEQEVKVQLPKVNFPEVHNNESLWHLPVIPIELDAKNDLINPSSVNIPSSVMSCLSEAIHWSSQGRELSICCDSAPTFPVALRNASHIQILVTGSIHLVGGALKLVDPTITKQ